MTRPRLLVVDDNPAIRDVWCDALSLFGYAVMAAGDGAEALALFDATPFDLVLTDLLMAGMTGWQVAEAIRIRSATPVVLIAGLAEDEDAERAHAHGMMVLHKPVNLADLQRTVEQTLGSRQATAS
jgi:CheY-like chemotaxis protein